jgi:hypothetical protein
MIIIKVLILIVIFGPFFWEVFEKFKIISPFINVFQEGTYLIAQVNCAENLQEISRQLKKKQPPLCDSLLSISAPCHRDNHGAILYVTSEILRVVFVRIVCALFQFTNFSFTSNYSRWPFLSLTSLYFQSRSQNNSNTVCWLKIVYSFTYCSCFVFVNYFSFAIQMYHT